MGYPYGETYLEQIQKDKDQCQAVLDTFYTLRNKLVRDNPEKYCDTIDLSIEENFRLLGEAFELSADSVRGITDGYHFMWDICYELLGKY